MHRHWTQRFGALLFAVWFAVVGFQPAAADACPMHGVGQAAMGGHGMMMHGGHSMQMDSGADHGSAPGDQHAHHCTCPGSCCSGAAFETPARPTYGARFVAVVVVPSARPSDARVTWTDFILPFPTAPPGDLPA